METNKDLELVKLIEFTKTGWPDKAKNIPDDLQYYNKFRSDISIDKNLVFLHDKLIIPKTMRMEILGKMHEGHLGISKMKSLARELYYWPKMGEHIEQLVRKCFVCQTHQNANVKEPLLSHEIPELPFSKLGVDILDFKNKSYMVIYDYFSKWLDIKLISNKSAKCTNNALLDVFCNHGSPNEIVSDHVPFDSKECKEFALGWGFKYTYSSPRYPQSNGMAERAVQIAKKLLKKCYDDKTDFRVALLHYRISPVCGTNFSPAQLAMNRNLKTKLPVCYTYLKPKLNENVKIEFSKSQNRNARYYNLNTKFKQEFYIGQNVMFLKDPNVNKWLHGNVEKKNGLRSYNIVDSNGVRYTRTSYHVRPV